MLKAHMAERLTVSNRQSRVRRYPLPLCWSFSMINLRTVVFAAAVAALPFTAMAASADAPASQSVATAQTTGNTAATPANHAKKPVHHVAHQAPTHKKTTTNSQS